MTQAVRNTQDGVSVVQIADGALSETTALLHRNGNLWVQPVGREEGWTVRGWACAGSIAGGGSACPPPSPSPPPSPQRIAAAVLRRLSRTVELPRSE